MGQPDNLPQAPSSCAESETLDVRSENGNTGHRREGLQIGSSLIPDLANDHRLIEHLLELLTVRVNQLHASHRTSESTLHSQLSQSLIEHFRKEERLLYPVLSSALGSDLCKRLRSEHTEIVSIAKKSNEKGPRSEDALRQLRRLLSAHISKEENVLFWYLELQNEDPRSRVTY